MSDHPRNAFSRVLLPAAVAAALFFAGCASEVVPTTGPHAPTSASNIKIYQKAPQKYEKLGLVTVSAEEGAKFDKSGNADVGFNRLKQKASALGANGLLLALDPNQFDRQATAGYQGEFYEVGIKGQPPVGVAEAIFVHKE